MQPERSKLSAYCEEVVETGRLLLQDADENNLTPSRRAQLLNRLDTLAFCIRDYDRTHRVRYPLG